MMESFFGSLKKELFDWRHFIARARPEGAFLNIFRYFIIVNGDIQP